MAAQDGSSRDQSPGRPGQGLQPREDHCGQCAGRGQFAAGPRQATLAQLFEQGPAVQRVAAGVVQELGHRPAGQVTDAECLGHGHQLLGPQAVQAQAGGPVVAPGEAAPCLAEAAQLT